MNKLYSQIASLVVIVGIGTAWAFNVVDATTFATISATLLSAIFALYQKYEKDEVIKEKLQLEDKVSILQNEVNNIESTTNYVMGIDPIEPKLKRIRKPKVK